MVRQFDKQPNDVNDLQARAEGRTLGESDQALNNLNATKDRKQMEELPNKGKKEVTDLIASLRSLKKDSRARLDMRNSPETLAILNRNSIPTEYLDKVLADIDAIDYQELREQINNGNITNVPEAITGGLGNVGETLKTVSLDLKRRAMEAGPFDAPIIAQLEDEVGNVEEEIRILRDQIIIAGEKMTETKNIA